MAVGFLQQSFLKKTENSRAVPVEVECLPC